MINKISDGEYSLKKDVVNTTSDESNLLMEQEKIKTIQGEKDNQKNQDLNQAKNLATQLLEPSNDSLNFLKDPLAVIFKKLDYYDRNKLQKSDIKKNPIDRAKEFISSFQDKAVSEIYNLKGSHNRRETEQSISKIVFNLGLLARDEKYKNIWQNTKNNIIEASLDVLGYDFENIERFMLAKHANFEDFWSLMDNKLSWDGIGNRMVITPNGERYDPQSDTMWKPLEASLYILKKSPYLSYGVAKNLVGKNYESYLNNLDIFDDYINKYDK